MTPLDLLGLNGTLNNAVQNQQNAYVNTQNTQTNTNTQNTQNTQNNQNPNNIQNANNQQNNQHNQNTEDLEKQTQKAIQQLMENLSYLNTHLNITIDKKADTTVIKIIDNKTNQVLKEIPPEYVLKIAEAINNLVGIFVNKKV